MQHSAADPSSNQSSCDFVGASVTQVPGGCLDELNHTTQIVSVLDADVKAIVFPRAAV